MNGKREEEKSLLGKHSSASGGYGTITRLDMHTPGKAPSFHDIRRIEQSSFHDAASTSFSQASNSVTTDATSLNQRGSSTSVASTSSGTSPKYPTYEGYVKNLDEEEIVAHLKSHENELSTAGPMIAFIINLSLGVNIILFVAKVMAFVMSGSLSVAASVVDSFLDLLVQAIIAIANQGKYSHDKVLFPAGKSRFEPVGIILCASLMLLAALELVGNSLSTLYHGFALGEVEGAVIDGSSISVIAAVIILKAMLWLYCQARADLSDSVATLAFDHRNDVLSNTVALAAILCVRISQKLWWTDALGCILISMYIAFNWYDIAVQKMNELVGRAADDEFVASLTHLVNQYHPESLQLDMIRAYHFGTKYLVEIEVILPADMKVREAHHIALALQQAVERMDNVERAFVHVDYKARRIDEHDPAAVARHRLDKIRRRQEQEREAMEDPTSPISFLGEAGSSNNDTVAASCASCHSSQQHL